MNFFDYVIETIRFIMGAIIVVFSVVGICMGVVIIFWASVKTLKIYIIPFLDKLLF